MGAGDELSAAVLPDVMNLVELSRRAQTDDAAGRELIEAVIEVCGQYLAMGDTGEGLLGALVLELALLAGAAPPST